MRQLSEIDGITPVFDRPVFHEAVMRFDVHLANITQPLSAQNIIGGYPIGDDYPELGNALLVCATETKTDKDIQTYISNLERILQRLASVACPVQPKMA